MNTGFFDTYILAQLIGLAAYSFYMAAPYYSKRHKILGIELAGCVLLCAHWHFMDVPVMVWSNAIWVYMIICGLLKPYTRHADALISLSFAFVVINAALHWQGSLIDVAAFMTTFLAVVSRFYIDLFKFRSLAFASAIFAIAIGFAADSASALVFNIIYALGHARGMIILRPVFFNLPGVNDVAPKLQPVRIKFKAR